MLDDVFCKIIAGEIKGDFVYRDDDFVVIKDINPQAPVHLLIVPVKHFTSLEDFIGPVQSRARDKVASPEDRGTATSYGMEGAELLGKALLIAHRVAHDTGIAEKGYRLIMNEGEYGGKLVPHLHIHLLGGKKLGPKMVN